MFGGAVPPRVRHLPPPIPAELEPPLATTVPPLIVMALCACATTALPVSIIKTVSSIENNLFAVIFVSPVFSFSIFAIINTFICD
jgi:hypothetical protein